MLYLTFVYLIYFTNSNLLIHFGYTCITGPLESIEYKSLTSKISCGNGNFLFKKKKIRTH